MLVVVITGSHEPLRLGEKHPLESRGAAPYRHDPVIRLVLQGSSIEAGRLGLHIADRRAGYQDRDRRAAQRPRERGTCPSPVPILKFLQLTQRVPASYMDVRS